MPVKGEKFGTKQEDFENLRVDGNDLYWHDKKIKVGGWTRAEKISLIGVIVSASVALLVAVLVYFDKIETTIRTVEEQLCQTGQFQFCKSISPAKPTSGTASAPR
ncbi:hypothetical protein SAMN05216344_12128 [Polaromonas sp. OV174]|uniref:hypothetical protein n=1 Tax=Polaromonas sp. OV174 TaxID=1855300 RepID=UPI0008DF90A5|nr:hypothetical protein [Polaromonas sp. OV174]SFC53788.1 hypothetical protein SAMN05216344_12128 [Polaromonas sp. OV174]